MLVPLNPSRRNRKRSWFLVLFSNSACLLALLAGNVAARASTITAPSLALADVQTAINSANNGDTVVLPAGSANWAAACTVTNKTITIQGAGAGLTVITNTQISNINTANGCVFIVNLANTFTRICGISFDGNQTANGICIEGGTQGAFQVDDCVFSHFYALAIQPCVLTGLINACTFIDNYLDIEVTPIGAQNDSWAQPLSVGTTNCVDVENCSFLYYTWSSVSALNTFAQGNGARTVFRNNTWTNFNPSVSFFPIVDMHGNMGVVSNSVTGLTPSQTVGANYGGGRGTFQFELYSNLFVSVANTTARLVHLRGGTCLAYGNTYVGKYMTPSFYVQEEDGPSRFNFLSNYPGYDQHWINIWSNTVNGALCSTVAYAGTGDNLFVVPGTNLFWSETPFANPAMTNYTPLPYPHPWIAAEPPAPQPFYPPSNLRVTGPPTLPPPVSLAAGTVATSVNNGLLAWWRLDEGAGATTADASGNGNTGTLQGSPTWLVPGPVSNAINFNGNGQYVSIGTNLPALQPALFTVTAWFLTGSSGRQIILASYSQNPGVAGFAFGIDIETASPGKLGLATGLNTGLARGSEWQSATSPGTVNDGTWHFGACTYDGANMNIYLDGNLVTTTPWAYSPGYAANNYIMMGAFQFSSTSTPNGFFNGSIDEVRLYNRPLSATEIASLFDWRAP